MRSQPYILRQYDQSVLFVAAVFVVKLHCQECQCMILRYQRSAMHYGPDPYKAGMYSELIPAICFPGFRLALVLHGLAPLRGDFALRTSD